jgi:hypothetical protein
VVLQQKDPPYDAAFESPFVREAFELDETAADRASLFNLSTPLVTAFSGEAAGKTSPAAPASSRLNRPTAIAQAQNLINGFRTETYAGKWDPSLNRKKIADRLLTLISNPDLVNQGANGLCGEAAFFNVWLWEDPLAVARFGVQLYNGGAASIGTDEWVRAGPSLRSQNFDKVILQMPNSPAADWSAEWMLMSALRDASNWVISPTSPTELGFCDFRGV